MVTPETQATAPNGVVRDPVERRMLRYGNGSGNCRSSRCSAEYDAFTCSILNAIIVNNDLEMYAEEQRQRDGDLDW